MANYLVTYRVKDGKQVRECFAASNRPELFNMLKERGISATHIEETSGKIKRTGQEKRPTTTLFKYSVAAVLVAGLSIGLFWAIANGNSDKKPTITKQPAKQGLTSKPTRVAPSTNAPASEPYKESPEELRRNGMWTDEDGNLRRRDGSYFFGKPNKEKPLHVNLISRHPEQTAFKRSSEISIAHVLMIEPGEPIENWVKFGKRFNDDFKASLDEKIEILPDDDDYVKELKRAVIETKEELRQRMNQGEDVAEIINEARAELERLGQYREDLKKQVLEIANDPNLTEKDLEDLSKAADEMLKDKGVPALSNSKIFKLQLRLAAAKAKEQK